MYDSIEPIGETARQQVRAATLACIRDAEIALGRQLPRLEICFDLSGGTAGMFRARDALRQIRYNPWIFAKHWEDNLANTVPHEVAHFLVHETRGRRRVRPHGPEWRLWMDFFGADPAVTFDLDISGVPRRRQRTHAYTCACRTHDLSSTRHNRVQRGSRYLCRYCHGALVYAGR
ncbi:SprT-like domain-containing protein [Haliea sp. E17]|uniref:SprT family zinc-dependent metalloprotease n=1 Tax=Haliea sp. E17 TaxID=3401576 RepID=UPI003AAD7311